MFLLLALAAPTVPPGYTIAPATTPGLVQRPVHCALDGRGALFVTEASGTNDPAKKQLEDRPHRIVRLTDADRDGVYDTRDVWADNLMLPQGILWHDGSIYVACPPSIWKLTPMKDGVRREEWFDGKTLTGCANDLHGPWAGPDGWIYWTKGAFAEQRYKRPGRPDFVTKASHVFRARPDGTGVEAVMVGGMDNPVGLGFTAGGERLFSATFLQHPAGGKRDGLAHAVYGAIHGKDHGVIHEHHPWTGPKLMPIMTHLGPAAPANLCVVGDTIYATQFNLRRVSKHTLEPSGATFTTEDEDFVVSDDMDFHPTDVIEDGDGSLIVTDTGGWYKLCCPTSVFHKPDVVGGLWRVRKEGAKPVFDVARRRRDGLWALARRDDSESKAAVRRRLADEDETLRQVALHIVSLNRDADAAEACRALLKGKSAHNRRAAAEVLGRVGAKAAVPDLLAALPGADDVLTHSVLFALIEIADADAVRPSLSGAPAVRRGAIIVLDQLGKLTAEDATAALADDDAALREAAWWVVGRHPEWATSLIGFFRRRLEKGDDVSAELARFAARSEIQDVMAERFRDGAAKERSVILKAMAASGLKALPKAWAAPLGAMLKAEPKALDVVRLLNGGGLVKDALSALADADVKALAALPPGALSERRFRLALEAVRRDEPYERRAPAADVLSRSPLSAEQKLALAQALPTVGPLEVARLLDAFATADEAVGAIVFKGLRGSGIHADVARTKLAKVPNIERFVRELDADAAGQKERLDAMLKALDKGDVRRGMAVFHSQKAACAACHAVGYVGGKAGPDLTRVGKVRTRRDLLEAVVVPSASFVRSYEPVTVRTRRGAVHNGTVKEESATHVVLALGATEEVRVSRKEIEEMLPGKASIMPAGLEKVLTPQELADLIAFLEACR